MNKGFVPVYFLKIKKILKDESKPIHL